MCFFSLCSGLRIAVNVLSLSFQAGFVGEYVLTCFFFYFFVTWSYLSFDLIPKLKQRSSLVEPFYGTICLYNRERREKLSEDFIFRMSPAEMQNVSRRDFSVSSFFPISIFIRTGFVLSFSDKGLVKICCIHHFILHSNVFETKTAILEKCEI